MGIFNKSFKRKKGTRRVRTLKGEMEFIEVFDKSGALVSVSCKDISKDGLGSTRYYDKAGFLLKYKENEIKCELSEKMLDVNHSAKKDKDIGLFMGYSNLLGFDQLKPGYKHKTQNTHHGKKYVEVSNANQEDFLKLVEEISPELRAISFFKCPNIYDYSLLERFNSLEFVHGYWNNRLRNLWNAEKTPILKSINFVDYSKLDLNVLSNFTSLKQVLITGNALSVKSFDFLTLLENLEQLYMMVDVLSNDIRPILELKTLKNYYIGDRYHRYINKFLKDGIIPPPSIYSDMPTRSWLEDETTSLTKKQIKQIEKILSEYSKNIASAKSIMEAKEIALKCVLQLNELSENIETEEREQLVEYLSIKVKDDWQDEIEQVVDETRDW